jgi:hypothetical protein
VVLGIASISGIKNVRRADPDALFLPALERKALPQASGANGTAELIRCFDTDDAA